MFNLTLLNPGCSQIPVLAAKQNHLVRTEPLLTRAASGLIGQLLPTSPTFLSQKEKICLRPVAFRRLSSKFTNIHGTSRIYFVTEYQRKFILLKVHTEKLQ